MYAPFCILWTLAVTTAAKTIVITAGSGGLAFSPDSVTADVGDILAFHFVSSIHSAVSGNFSSPCVQSSTGFDSGPVTSVRFSPSLSLISSFPANCVKFALADKAVLCVVRCLPSNSPNHRPDLVLLRHSRPLSSWHGRRRQRSILRRHSHCI